MAWSNKYTIELWSKSGVMLADFSGRATDRKITESRNYPESIEFSLDLNSFESYCRAAGISDPKQLLITNSTEVRVRRAGTYITGGQLVYKNVSITGEEQQIQCRVQGFLGLFAKRRTGETPAGFISEVYTAVEGSAKSRTDLAWHLIDASQQLINGNFGVTRGLVGGSTTLYDKTYSRTNIGDALQAMTTYKADPIDIEFTYNKVFNTYAQIGSDRPDIIFEYPGNIKGLEAPDDGTDVTNEVTALGQGAADGTQKPAFGVDIPSQLDYQLRQDIVQSNGTDDSNGGITDAAEAAKDAKSRPINIPSLTINGNVAPYVTDYRIGDRVRVKINDHPLIDDINGIYRIEKRTITVDDNDNETVKLEVSKWE